MPKLEFTPKFKKDYKGAKRQGRNMRVLENVLETLQREEELPHSFTITSSLATTRGIGNAASPPIGF